MTTFESFQDELRRLVAAFEQGFQAFVVGFDSGLSGVHERSTYSCPVM